MNNRKKQTFTFLLKILTGLIIAYVVLYFSLNIFPLNYISLGFLGACVVSFVLLRKDHSLAALLVAIFSATISGVAHSYYLGLEGAFPVTLFAIFFAIFFFTPFRNRVALFTQFAIVTIASFLSFYMAFNIEPAISLPYELSMLLVATNIAMVLVIIGGGVFISAEAAEKGEKELVENRNILRAIYNSNSDAGLLIGPDKRIMVFNKPAVNFAQKYYGKELEAGMAMSEVLTGHQWDQFQENFDKTIRGEPIDYIMKVDMDGEELWLETTYTKVLGENQTLWGVGININDITEKQRYREEVKKLALIIREIDNAVVISDLEERIEWVNAGFTRMTGYTLEELRGKKPKEILQGENTDMDTVQRISNKLLKGESVREEILNYTKDGREIWVDMTIQPLYNESGEIENYIAVETDITGNKQREKELKRNEQLLMQMGKMADIGAWEFDLVSEDIFWTKQTYEIFELPREQKITLDIVLNHFEKQSRAILEEKIQRCVEQGEPYFENLRFISAAGRDKWVKVMGMPEVEDGKVKRLVGAIQDITAQMEAEQAYRESELQLESLNKNIQDGLYRSTPDKGMVYANEAFARIFGYQSVEEVLAHDINDFNAEEKDREKFLKKLKKSGQVRNQELLLKRKDGTHFWAMISGSINRGANGDLYIDGSIRDITRLKETQQALIEAKDKAEKATMAKAEFLSTMSHEIRTPMNAVIGMTQLLMMEEPRIDQLEHLETLKFSAENLMHLINDILDYSKIEAGRIEFEEVEFQPRLLLKGLYHGLQPRAKENGVMLTPNIAKDVPKYLVGDPTRLSQVLSNLLSNAIKFTRNGEVVTTVSVKEKKAGKVRLHFSVKDDGIGISPEKQEAIFESFEQADPTITRKYGGTGLGLAITKNLLEHQGSQIHVDSEPGKGSVFYFELQFPYAQTEEIATGTGQHQAANSDLAHFEGMKVLVVEDNLINQRLTCKFLSKWKIDAATAHNGKEAVEMVRNGDLDLVLMDLQMPVMDGYSASQAIREFDQEIPIIALSASTVLEIQDRVYEVGMNDFISKPVNLQELNNKLSKYFQRKLSS